MHWCKKSWGNFKNVINVGKNLKDFKNAMKNHKKPRMLMRGCKNVERKFNKNVTNVENL